MKSERQPAGGRQSAHNEAPAATDERDQRLHQWYELLEQRDRAADEREAVADRREKAADQREAQADRRERAADEREAATDRRELQAKEREYRLHELQRRLDDQTHGYGPHTNVQQRAREAIARSNKLVAVSRSHLQRSEDALKRAQAHADRERQQTDRRIAGAERVTRKARSDVIQSDMSPPLD